MLRALIGASVVVGVTGLAALAPADEVATLTPGRDNSLFEVSGSETSSAAGVHLFAGKTSINTLRRALIRFDVSSIPAGATVTGVELRLSANRGDGLGSVFELHRVTSDWGQGTSNAGEPGGLGAPATPGDPTWTASFFGSQTWRNPGGDYVAAASAAQPVDGAGVAYTWASTPALVADVQGWLNGTTSNFGWVLLGGEDTPGSAVRFSSMEGTSPPTLTVTYQLGPTCGPQDFNGDGDSGTDQDIEAFFACLGGNCCATCWAGGSDFNGDGDFGTDQDIESFFRVLGGAAC